jgi:hypothetical protein
MNKLRWWMRIVGAFNLFLGVVNVVALLAVPSFYEGNMPYTAGGNVTLAFGDAWMAFVLDLVAVGLFLLWASRKPAANINVVYLVVLMEFLHGVVDDAFLVARGYSASGYIAFICVHLAIIVTGIVFARSASRELAASPQHRIPETV